MSFHEPKGAAESSRDAQRRQQVADAQAHASHTNLDDLGHSSLHTTGIDHLFRNHVAFSDVTTDAAVVSQISEAGEVERSHSPEEEEMESGSNTKKRKITRARNACLPAPEPCGSCIKDEMLCIWPTADGRSAEARKNRNYKRRKSKEQTIEKPVEEVKTDQDLWSGLLEHDWLSEWGVNPSANQSFDFTSTTFPTFDYSLPIATQPQPGLPAFSADPSVNSTLDPLNLNSSIASPDWLSTFDPAQVVLALSGRLPVVEDGSVHEDRPAASDTSSVNQDRLMFGRAAVDKNLNDDDKVVKVTWWRPHGQTAIVPGLQRIILKVRVQRPGTGSQASTPISPEANFTEDLIGPDRMPNPAIMHHLLDSFFIHFGCQFPFLERNTLESSITAGTGSSFLLLCIASVTARFSSHPRLALKHLKPFEYGNEFYAAAKALLGSMLSVPSRETVMGLVLLAHVGLGTGLQLNPPAEAQISPEDRRLNRLLFWSVLILDFALAFGTGRQPTLRVDEITQLLPSPEDMTLSPSVEARSPFPYAARQMLAYGQLITELNSGRPDQEEIDKAVIVARSKAIQVYNTLPEDLHWNVTNLQHHTKANQGPMYLHLHLWMHTIIASGYLTNTDYIRRGATRSNLYPGVNSGHVTPNAVAASNLWKNSARTIGDVLVLSDILNPNAYLSLPFCNQAFYVAGCCYVKEIEQEHVNLDQDVQTRSEPPGIDNPPPDNSDPAAQKEKDPKKPSDLFRSLLTSVAANNITTVQQGLTKQTNYWAGIAWVAEALAQRVAGIGASEIDLASITEKLSSSVYVADSGVLKGSSIS
ncbi:uncharacterized protein I303_104095 [Kwoniella dejecticola CBS 10117]|uniref:Xylanolytic transcriptional activator regulatory domain-containing protein n=1 Tax=Kwoniella dejecticola CBS 10117 TaxID=1296121 RepID=A0AAJ8KPU1_9TREE